MKVLVTGGAGFIGTNLTKKLLDLGNRVVGVDNFYSSDKNRVNLFKRNKNYSFIRHDVRRPLKINQKIDQIYNLACPASPPIYQKNPLYTLETSVFGIVNMLKLAKEHQAIFLQASTSEVYGNPLQHPQKESYFGNVNTVGPRSCYDEGKRVAETFCYLNSLEGVDVRLVRIFNTYGPYMDPKEGRVIVNFIVQALNNRDMTIYGDGSQTRSFCFVSDLIEGITKYMNLKKPYFGPINLGNPEEFSMKELAKKVLEAIPESKSKIIFRPLPVDDPLKRKPDISLAKKILNWEPKVKLEEGLKETINYFKV